MRSTAVGIVTGVVALAAIAGFGVGLPKVIDDPSSTAEIPTLPEEVGGLQAVSTLTAEETGVAEAQLAQFDEMLASAADSDTTASDNLGEQYGDAAVRMYVDAAALAGVSSGGSVSQLTATVVPGEAGLLMPGGPYQADTYQLEEIDGNKCSVVTQNGYSATGEASVSYQVECRTSVEGLTYDVYTIGMAPEDASAALDELVAGTA